MTLTLVFPNVTTTTAEPTFSAAQFAFAAVVSLVFYSSFLFVQSVRHRDYFLPRDGNAEGTHAPPPPNKVALASAGLLLVSLFAVMALAKALTPAMEGGVEILSAPKNVVGIIIAALELLPQGLASFCAASANRLQTTLNLALGSVLASIVLTIPAVAGGSILLHKPLTLGLCPQRRSSVGSHSNCQRAHLGHRLHHRAAGNRAPGSVRGFLFPGDLP